MNRNGRTASHGLLSLKPKNPGLSNSRKKSSREKSIELMDEILDAQTEDGKEPDPAEVPKMPRQTLPEEMQGQIPADVPPGLEQQPEK